LEEQKIKYLVHPVSPKEVKKWREKGFEILDERFNPNPKAPKEAQDEYPVSADIPEQATI
jgi:hypothetical protein